jgi:hypothetical protein
VWALTALRLHDVLLWLGGSLRLTHAVALGRDHVGWPAVSRTSRCRDSAETAGRHGPARGGADEAPPATGDRMTALSPRPARSDALEPALLGRAAAVLALVSAVVHLLLVDLSTLGSLAMLGMALACLPCAWHLWTARTGRVWALTAAADAAMLLLHVQMLAPQSGHHHATAAPDHAVGLMLTGVVLVAGQLALAAVTGLLAARR